MHSKSPSVMAFCLVCLGILAKNMPKRLAGYYLLNSYHLFLDILKEGSRVAQAKAAETLNDVKASMRINYFDSDQSDMYQK